MALLYNLGLFDGEFNSEQLLYNKLYVYFALFFCYCVLKFFRKKKNAKNAEILLELHSKHIWM